MNSMPESSNPCTIDVVTAAIVALQPYAPKTREQAADMLLFWVRRSELTEAGLEAVLDMMFPEPSACPEWCTFDHSKDTAADDLSLHMGDDNTDGTVRRLFDLSEGMKLDIRLARTDSLSEGKVGAPTLLVRTELEVTTWEQAAELARTILDGFGYLHGA